MGRAVACELCGQMFFPASLKFHQKTCQEKQAKTMTECAYCGDEMPQAALDDHLRKCKPAREMLGSPQAAEGDGHGAFSGTPSRLPDGRIACHFCGRGFAANRVHQHAKICGKLKQARPRAPDGSASQAPEKVYIGNHAEFSCRESEQEKPVAQSHPSFRSQSPPKRQQSEPPPKKTAHPVNGKMPLRESNRQAQMADSVDNSDSDGWRAKHREFIAAIRVARGGGKPSEPSQPALISAGEEQASRRQPQIQNHSTARQDQPASESISRDSASISRDPSATKPSAVARAAQAAQPVAQQRPRSPSKRPAARPNERGEFAQGSRVQVQGLVHAAHLNGNVAVLLEYDVDAGCWLASLENGVVKSLRTEHMVALTPPMAAVKSESSSTPKTVEPSPVAGTRTLTTLRSSSPKRPTQNARHVSAPEAACIPQDMNILNGSLEAVSRPPSNPSTHRVTSLESPRHRVMPLEHVQTPKARAPTGAWAPTATAMEVRRTINTRADVRPMVSAQPQHNVQTMSKSVLAPHPPSSLRLFTNPAQPYQGCARVASNAALQPCPSPMLCKQAFRAA